MKGVQIEKVLGIGIAMLLLSMLVTTVIFPTYVVGVDEKGLTKPDGKDRPDKTPPPGGEDKGPKGPPGEDKGDHKGGDKGDGKPWVPGGDKDKDKDRREPIRIIREQPIVIKKTIHEEHHDHNNGNGNGGKNGYWMTEEEYNTMKLVWENKIVKGQHPEIDKIMNECFK